MTTTIDKLQTKRGLTTQQVQERILKGQVNRIGNKIARSYSDIIKEHVFTYFNFINLFLFAFVCLTGQYGNGLFIITIICNSLIGMIQDIHAKRIIDRLTILIATEVEVLRDETWIKQHIEDLVLDDWIRLKSGMQIPADCIIQEGYLEMDESILTGESTRLAKNVGDTLLAGTIITAGDAIAKIIHVGKDNFSETILQDARKHLPAKSLLKENTNRLLHIISLSIGPIGLILFLKQHYMLDATWQTAILRTVSALIGMIPEGLVVLISIALSVGVIRLGKRKVLVQDMYSIESLARVDVLCVDKTGTLTEGKMHVEELLPGPGYTLDQINEIMGNYTHVFHEGNATEEALVQYFEPKETYHTKQVLPFSSDRKYAAITFEKEGTYYVGAYDFLFPNGNNAISEKIQTYNKQGNRVLLLAHSIQEIQNQLPSDLKLVCIFVLKDVLRTQVKDIIRYLQNQDVMIKVISGDHPQTVSVLAKEAGILKANQLVDMHNVQENIEEAIKEGTVFGRVLPSQKKEMVLALQKQGYTVAMVGDGVNDVPALRVADVGVAMASGTQAAKNTADIVLLQNDFGEMPQIINEGRRVINNITRAASMYLVKTIFSILLSIYVILLPVTYPFLPIHLTIISMFSVGIPTFLLQLEPSFEKAKERFYWKAFHNALPSALTIFLLAITMPFIRSHFALSPGRNNAILVILTACVYFYTLYKVYTPLDRFRITILSFMVLGFLFSIMLLRPLLTIEIIFQDVWFILFGIILLPILIYLFSLIQKWIMQITKRGK